MNTVKAIFSWLYAGLAGVGLAGVSLISWQQFSGISSCPGIGTIPVCYVVLICYAAVLVSVFARRTQRPWFFWPGWTVIFSAAALGSSLELAGHVTCPRSAGGTPTCYFSLLMSILIVLFYLGAIRGGAD